MTIKYRKRLFRPIEIYQDDNSIKVVERMNRFWIFVILRVLFFIAVYIGFYYIFKKHFDDHSWLYLAILMPVFAVTSLTELLVWWYYHDKNDLYISVPQNALLNTLNVFEKSGTVYISDIVANEFIIKVVSGKLYLQNAYAKNLQVKITSGKAFIGEEHETFKTPIEKFTFATKSGSAIHGITIKSFNAKISSESVKLYNASLINANVKCSSGGIKGNNVAFNEDFFVKISSGSVKLDNVTINNSFKAAITSGTLRLNEITGHETDFMITTKTRSGSIRINDIKVSSIGYKLVESLPTKQIDTTITSGTARLNFKNR